MIFYNKIIEGDCLDIIRTLEDESVDLIYLDPPFYTQKTQRMKARDRTIEFSYNDVWGCHKEYTDFLFKRLVELKRVLKGTGNIFVHCDKNANHIIRAILDDIFYEENFRSEIIWYYKRWSSAKKGLLPAHQTIYFYSKSNYSTFHVIYNDYSESTNIDQILQKRARDEHGKAIYAKNEKGEIVLDDEKNGVPLSDVWDIPFLNPKAKERVGYPTQKPILLLDRIIEIASNLGDLVLDPFCGSGTTLVAAQLLGRKYIGIDISKDAVKLSESRLNNPIKSDSDLIKNGRESYVTADSEALALLDGLEYIPVHRNNGIDAILRSQFNGTPVLVRIQKKGELLSEAISLLALAAKKKGSLKSFLIKTNNSKSLLDEYLPDNIHLIESIGCTIKQELEAELISSSIITSLGAPKSISTR